jgi:N-acetylated-alpha-linked acidic dipeptidase
LPEDASWHGISPTLEQSLLLWQPRLVSLVDAERMTRNLKTLSAHHHPTGSPRQLETAEFVHKNFLLAGLESRIETRDVLVSAPIDVTVEMLRPQAYRCPMTERAIDQDFDTHTPAPKAHLDYAAEGDVTGILVYVNRSRSADFAWLADQGVSLRGRIGIARARSAMGSQVLAAAEAGLAALVLFADPASDGYTRGDPYPRGPWRPDTAITRGTALDLASHPGSPPLSGASLGSGYLDALPGIPAATLSFADARPLLQSLQGSNVPEDWQGGLPFPYHVGGTEDVVVRVRVAQELAIRRIWNVVGELRGSLFPDQWVVAGAGRDAACFGASTGGSGTTVLLETASVLGALSREGRRPARSLRFHSFDGTLPGFLGSVELTRDDDDAQTDGCGLYIDLDAAVSGDRLEITVSPELLRLVTGTLEAAGKPDAGVAVDYLPASSNAMPFLHHRGIPTVRLRATGPTGVRGTAYDTYGWMKRFGDPGLEAHRRLSTLAALLAYRASEVTVDPIDLTTLARWIALRLEALGDGLGAADRASLDDATAALAQGADALDRARSRAAAADPDPLRLAASHRALLALPRLLLLSEPRPERPFFRHILAAPDPEDSASTLPLPDLTLAIRSGDPSALSTAAARLADALRTLASRATTAARLTDPQTPP